MDQRGRLGLHGQGGPLTQELQGKPMTWERTGLLYKALESTGGMGSRPQWRGGGLEEEGGWAHRVMDELVVGPGSCSAPTCVPGELLLTHRFY